jgi:hypothetical protein
MRPRRLTHDLGDAPAELQRLLEQRTVGVDRSAPRLLEQLTAQPPVVRLLEERVELRVVERDAVRALGVARR